MSSGSRNGSGLSRSSRGPSSWCRTPCAWRPIAPSGCCADRRAQTEADRGSGSRGRMSASPGCWTSLNRTPSTRCSRVVSVAIAASALACCFSDPPESGGTVSSASPRALDLFKGRLGLDTARIPHADRAGLLWLSRGALTARDGTLSFERGPETAENDPLEPGRYAVPFQGVSMILLGPGSTVSHDALRLLARHGTALAAVGEDGVRCYTAPPLIADRSGLARRQAQAWADADARLQVARRMYAWRMGEVLPHRDIAVLRGIEGARMKETYRLMARRTGVEWRGRRYDRARPNANDLPNQALNHASSAVEAAAAIAVSATATVPPARLHPRGLRPVLRARHRRLVSRLGHHSRGVPRRQEDHGGSGRGQHRTRNAP